MASVKVMPGEPFESAFRRFKKACIKENIMLELRKRECYEKPSIKRRKKSLEARKRAAREK